MEKGLHFGNDTSTHMPSYRLAKKRILIRGIYLLAIAGLAYQFLTSFELRKSDSHREVAPVPPQRIQVQPVVITETAQATLQDGEAVSDKWKHGRFPVRGKENATLVMLVRNSELKEALASMRQLEDRFNKHYHYPWTFMNDVPFTEDFIRATSGMASGPVEYQEIPKENWGMPSSLNQSKVDEGMRSLIDQRIIYGGSLSYRHMCRFNSGFFYNQDVMKKYEWYWRVEPGIELYCDIEYDPFTYMRENKKVYGFVISMYEFFATIPTLWDTTKEFITKNPQYLAANNSLPFLVDDAKSSAEGDKSIDGEYNMCHFWSNFEIASLGFYRSEAYSKYFEYLDQTGGFFYERWGDAPVHSLGVGLFLPKEKIHHFADFGYNHSPAARCPTDDRSHDSGRCLCDRKSSFDSNDYSCLPRWWKLAGVNHGAENSENLKFQNIH